MADWSLATHEDGATPPTPGRLRFVVGYGYRMPGMLVCSRDANLRRKYRKNYTEGLTH
jgi:hypothetical protein